jgi:hypothetical protein
MSASISMSAIRKRSSKSSHLEGEAEQAAQARAGAVGGEQPARLRDVVAGIGFDPDHGMVAMALEADQPVPEAELDLRVGGAGGDEDRLDRPLRQVDEGRHLVAVLGQEVDGEDLAVAVEGSPDLPGDAAGEHRAGDAEAVEDLERALGPADRPAAGGELRRVVEDDGGNAAPREVERDGQADGASADHDDRVARLRAVGGRGGGERAGKVGHGAIDDARASYARGGASP